MITSKQLNMLAPYKKTQAKGADGTVIRFCVESNGAIFVFSSNSRKYGHRVSDVDTFCSYYTLKGKNDAEQWKANVTKVVKLLTESGLWPNILELFKNLEKMSYEDFIEISKRYVSMPYIRGESDEDRQKRIEEVFGDFTMRYPFVFNGVGQVDYDYLSGGLADAKLKTMYFGKYRNQIIKSEAKQALADKVPYKGFGHTSYDVTFTYDPINSKAYYTEEYKGCGNGHYYLALNENTALFCEDD